ncbi:MAG: hypothetical protein QF805_15040, partial [Pirellulaceae bacterium]|nr:hypothetical protein [Pirellulaceae bacterium]
MPSAWRKVLQRRRKQRRKRRPNQDEARLGITRLEDRRVLSVSTGFAAGQLMINLAGANETATVSTNGLNIEVTDSANTVVGTHTIASVDSINAEGDAGTNQRLVIESDLTLDDGLVVMSQIERVNVRESVTTDTGKLTFAATKSANFTADGDLLSNSGDIFITTERLIVESTTLFDVDKDNAGAAGAIDIKANRVALPTVNTTSTLTVESLAGEISDLGKVSVTDTIKLTANGGGTPGDGFINLDQLDVATAKVEFSSTGTAAITNTGDLTIVGNSSAGAPATGFDLTLGSTTGSITSSSFTITVADDLQVNAANNVTLNNLEVDGAIGVNAANATITNDTTVVLNESNVMGTFDVKATAGDILDAGDLAQPTLTKFFDFNGSATQTGYTGVSGSTTYNATLGYGWDANVTEYSDFSEGGINSLLRRDGHKGTVARRFRVDLPNTTSAVDYLLNFTIGDPDLGHQDITITDVTPGNGNAVLVNSVDTPFDRYLTIPAVINAKDFLEFEISTTSGNWVINGFEIRPKSDTEITLTSPGPVEGDGVTVDKITGTVAPNALLTVSSTLGTIINSDANTQQYPGIQIQADGSGDFEIEIRRAPSAGTPKVSVHAIDGSAFAEFEDASQLSYYIPTIRRFDFGNEQLQTGFTSVTNTTIFSPAVGFGWLGAVGSFGFNGGVYPNPADLYRDGNWGSTSETFSVFSNDGSIYDVEIFIGDGLSS